MFGQFFFWAGLASVAAFFAGAALLGMSFFSPTERARHRLALGQTAVVALLLVFTAYCAWMLRDRLAPWAQDPPPQAGTALYSAIRETMSVLLLGLSATVGALLAAFAWIRHGRAGAAFRTLLWAIPAVRLVTACAAGLDFFDSVRTADAELGEATIAATGAAVAAAAERGVLMAAAIAAGLALLSWPLGFWIARASRLRSETAK